VSFVMAGPTTDFGYASFGSDVTSPGYVSENAAAASQCGQDGSCTYTFTLSIPANATGSDRRRGASELALLPGRAADDDAVRGR
jgi:hypothetical protein